MAPTFTSRLVEDDTGDETGGHYSYRVCIFDWFGNVTASNIAADVAARDTVTPPPLTQFPGQSGSDAGQIRLTVTFPASTADYDRVEIRRKAGATPPEDCDRRRRSGTLIRIYTETGTPDFDSDVFIDDTASPGQAFSYRACVKDAASPANLTDGDRRDILASNATEHEAMAITSGYDHTCAILADRRVRCWGDNTYGQLGLGHANGVEGPAAAVALPAAAIKLEAAAITPARSWRTASSTAGDATTRRSSGSVPTPPSSARRRLRWTTSACRAELALGGKHTCIVTTDDEGLCWGDNSRHQVGGSGSDATPANDLLLS